MAGKTTIIAQTTVPKGRKVGDVQTYIAVGKWSVTIAYTEGEPLPFIFDYSGDPNLLEESDMWDLVDLADNIRTRLR